MYCYMHCTRTKVTCSVSICDISAPCMGYYVCVLAKTAFVDELLCQRLELLIAIDILQVCVAAYYNNITCVSLRQRLCIILNSLL